MAKTPAAQIISANRLTDGVIVFLTADGWSERPADALVLAPDGFDAALARAKADAAANVVIEVEAVEVASVSPLRPAHLRDVIRLAGPTVRADLGKQAAR